MKSIFYTFVIFASLLLIASSCSESTTPTKVVQVPQLKDNQIINIMMVVDKGEIAASQIAIEKQASPSVDNYARYLIQMHQKNLDELNQLAKKLDLSPTESILSNSMAADEAQNLKKLGEMQGAAFDSAYMNAMVTGHQNGLNLVDTTLLPQAQNPKLKTAVEQFRKMVDEHLEKGLKVQKNL